MLQQRIEPLAGVAVPGCSHANSKRTSRRSREPTVGYRPKRMPRVTGMKWLSSASVNTVWYRPSR